MVDKKLMNLCQNDAQQIAASEAIICDLDGTLYLDNRPIPGAQEFLQQVKRTQRKLYYFTNNTSASRQSYFKKIAGHGFPIEDEFLITAADCADAYLKRNGLFPNIYLVGNQELTAEFEYRGFVCLSEKEIVNITPQAVVLGFDTELSYSKIQNCYNLLMQNIPYVATHGDILCPVTKNTFKPDIGSFISLFETATSGKLPTIVGKPSPEAVSTIRERANMPIDKIAFIGDRLYTDIKMAKTSGMTSILVLSGETSLDMLLDSQDQPDIIVDSVADLTTHLKR